MSRRLGLVAGAWLVVLAGIAAGPASDPRLANYRWPPGWKVEIAAAEPLVINPTAMTFGLDGRLYVIEWLEGRAPNDRIKVLTDNDGDGLFDKADVFMDGFDVPAQIMLWDGWTYVSHEKQIDRFQDRDGDGKFEVKETIVSGFQNNNSQHRVSGMLIGPDGWLYVTTADAGTFAKGSDGSTASLPRCGGLLRCRPDGSRLEVVALGMRNPWANVSYDDTFHMFHTDNDSENTIIWLNCKLNHVVEGGDYGWRTREGVRGGSPDPERSIWNGGRPGRLPSITLTGRGAPPGLCILNSAAFPPSTRNLLIHPDVFRRKVQTFRLQPAGATYKATEDPVLLTSDEGVFRPDDAEIGPDGALYILDWRNDHTGASSQWGNGQLGRIYRLTWSGTPQEPARPTLPRDRLVKLVQSDDRALVEALKSDDFGYRMTANRELVRRAAHGTLSKDIPGAVVRLLADRDLPLPTRCHALIIAESQGFEDVSKYVNDPAPDLRRLAYEMVGRFAPPDDSAIAGRLLARVADEHDPQCIRALGMALGRFQGLGRAVAQALLEMAARHTGSDPYLRDGMSRGFERLGSVGLEALVQGIEQGEPASRRSEAALYALASWRNPDGLKTILAEATSKTAIPSKARGDLFFALREFVADVPPGSIAEWLRSAPEAGSEARVEAIRVLKALRQRATAATVPVLPALLSDASPDVRSAALALAVEVRSPESEKVLLQLAKSSERSAEERSLAVDALRGYRDRSLAPVFEELYQTSKDGKLRGELLRALAAIDSKAAAAHARELLRDPDPAQRAAAIALLGERSDSALELVKLYGSGNLPAEDVGRVIEAVRTHSSPELKAAMEALIKNKMTAFPPEMVGMRLRRFVSQYGDPERGKALFLNETKTRCSTCHRIEGRGGSVGPDLTRIWESLPFEKRVESILEPSKDIKEGFTSYKVATTDGRVLTGLLLSETSEAVTLKDAQGQEVRIPQKEIEAKAADTTSLMPLGVVGQLSFAEFADLLAFLGDRKAQESLRSEEAGSAGK